MLLRLLILFVAFVSEPLSHAQSTSVEELIGRLSHLNPEVRGRACHQLAAVGDDRAVEPILRVLATNDENLRISCVRALETLKDVRAVPELLQLLRSAGSSETFSITYALGAIGPSAVPSLVEALQDSNASVRQAAAEALGIIRDERSVTPLIELLSDSSTNVRKAAATALGEIGNLSAAESLIATLKNDAPIMTAAIASLGKIGDPRAVEIIAKHLNDDVRDVKLAAVRALAALGSVEAVSHLMTALDDPDSLVRGFAARGLGKFNNPAATRRLMALLSDPVVTVRMDAVRTLRETGDPLVLPFLIEAIKKDRDWLARRELARAIGSFGEPGAEWLVSAVNGTDGNLREAAAMGLGALRNPETLDLLAILASDSNVSVRHAAIDALGATAAPQAVKPLLAALSDSDEYFRNEAINALSRLGEVAVNPLLEALRSVDPAIRKGAIQALAQIELTPKALVEVLSDPDPEVRSAAAPGLQVDPASLDGKSRGAIVASLNARDVNVRLGIIRALGMSATGEFTALLTAHLRDSDPAIRRAVIDSLLNTPSPPSFLVFTDALLDADVSVRRAAAQAIATLGDETSYDTLLLAAKDSDAGVRSWAVIGLGHFGLRASKPLIDILSTDEDWGVRAASARALGAAKSTEAISALIANLNSKYWNFADTVAEALQQIGQPAVPALLQALGHRDPEVRELAAESLGMIATTSAVQPLIDRLTDEDGFVRTAAAGALGRIGEPAATALLAAAKSSSGIWALRFLEGGPDGNGNDHDLVRNRLRNHYRSSGIKTDYLKFVPLCSPAYCLEKYTWPGFPLLGFPRLQQPQVEAKSAVIDQAGRVREYDANGTLIPDRSSEPRKFPVTLTINEAGSVMAVEFEEPGMEFTGIDQTLRSWKFGTFAPGTSFPLQHRLVLEYSTRGRPRYQYGRPWVEFEIDRVSVISHRNLPHID